MNAKQWYQRRVAITAGGNFFKLFFITSVTMRMLMWTALVLCCAVAMAEVSRVEKVQKLMDLATKYGKDCCGNCERFAKGRLLKKTAHKCLRKIEIEKMSPIYLTKEEYDAMRSFLKENGRDVSRHDEDDRTISRVEKVQKLMDLATKYGKGCCGECRKEAGLYKDPIYCLLKIETEKMSPIYITREQFKEMKNFLRMNGKIVNKRSGIEKEVSRVEKVQKLLDLASKYGKECCGLCGDYEGRKLLEKSKYKCLLKIETEKMSPIYITKEQLKDMRDFLKQNEDVEHDDRNRSNDEDEDDDGNDDDDDQDDYEANLLKFSENHQDKLEELKDM